MAGISDVAQVTGVMPRRARLPWLRVAPHRQRLRPAGHRRSANGRRRTHRPTPAPGRGSAHRLPRPGQAARTQRGLQGRLHQEAHDTVRPGKRNSVGAAGRSFDAGTFVMRCMAAAGQWSNAVDETHALHNERAAQAPRDASRLLQPAGHGIGLARFVQQINAAALEQRRRGPQESSNREHLGRQCRHAQGAAARATLVAGNRRLALALDRHIAVKAVPGLAQH